MIEKLKEILAEEEDSAAEEQEIVSWYVPRRREGEEVVSYYVQPTPLPRKLQQAQTAPKKRSRRGLWIFFTCCTGKKGITLPLKLLVNHSSEKSTTLPIGTIQMRLGLK